MTVPTREECILSVLSIWPEPIYSNLAQTIFPAIRKTGVRGTFRIQLRNPIQLNMPTEDISPNSLSELRDDGYLWVCIVAGSLHSKPVYDKVDYFSDYCNRRFSLSQIPLAEAFSLLDRMNEEQLLEEISESTNVHMR